MSAFDDARRRQELARRVKVGLLSTDHERASKLESALEKALAESRTKVTLLVRDRGRNLYAIPYEVEGNVEVGQRLLVNEDRIVVTAMIYMGDPPKLVQITGVLE